MDEENKVHDAIRFFEEGDSIPEWNALVFEDEMIHSEFHYAILRTTENGKYVRGNLLFYKFNGVEIYTDINNIIFVDTLNKTVFIRQHSEVINEIAPTDPEHKEYIILYVDEGSDDTSDMRWESYLGRTRAYKSLLLQLSVIDIDQSKVLVDNVPLKDALSVRAFLQYLKNANIVDEDEFDLEGYYE